MITYDPDMGHIDDVIIKAIQMAHVAQESVVVKFNGLELTVRPSHALQLRREYQRLFDLAQNSNPST